MKKTVNYLIVIIILLSINTLVSAQCYDSESKKAKGSKFLADKDTIEFVEFSKIDIVEL
jgi:hypothetical protein